MVQNSRQQMGVCRGLRQGTTYQLLLLHALHQDDEQMLGLGSGVCEGLLYSHQELVPQGFIYKSAMKISVKLANAAPVWYTFLLFLFIFNCHVTVHSSRGTVWCFST